MLQIKLSRIGKKNKPMYRLIISEKARDPHGRALEIFGSYNPHTKELKVASERIKHWLAQGAGMTPSVNNLLIEKGIIEGEKVKASRAKSKKKKAEAAPKPEIAEKDEQAGEGEGNEPDVKTDTEENKDPEKPKEEKEIAADKTEDEKTE